MEALFGEQGPLAKAFAGYQYRAAQVEMASQVEEVLREGGIGLIEAGTGIGKSMAYLAAAIRSGQTTVVSTHTISLQQQLIDKDIPRLAEALGVEIKAALMKGMSNYLCLRRLGDAMAIRRALGAEEREGIEEVASWSEQNSQGSLSDLPTYPSRLVRERIRMEGDGCNRTLCPHYKQCLFFAARRESSEADILVVNHHLLLADLALRVEGEAILPDYDQLIIDEAHHLEEVATQIFAERVSERDLDRIYGRLQSEGRLRTGRLDLIVDKVRGRDGGSKIEQKIEISIPAEKREASQALARLFLTLRSHFGTDRLRLLEKQLELPIWKEEVQLRAEESEESLSRLAQSLRGVCGDLESMQEDERLRSLRFDVEVLAGRLERMAERIYRFAFDPIDPAKVRWIEQQQLYTAQLDISELLERHLFATTHATVLSSATLATHRSFAFCRERLGIDPEHHRVVEAIHHSPFDYEQQSVLLLPSDLVPPDHPDYPRQATERIFDAIEKSGGNTFVLFTSYRMLQSCKQGLKESLDSGGYTLFCQGESERHHLLDQFRHTPKAVLFGTDSFWEGVDVAGDALRCVVLTKLPFRVPTEPIVEAQMDRILAKGGRPFVDYTLPQAIMKFKQGFGRLIRGHSDRGCIVCLDSRLIHKPYGRAFLGSLPPTPIVHGNREEILVHMERFYGA